MRDRSSIFWIFIAPFIWVYFFGFLAGGGDPSATRIGLTVIQQESTEPAERFIEHLRAQNFDIRVVKSGEPMPSGDSVPPRSVTIPAGFADAIANRLKVQLDLHEEERASPEGTLAVRVALHKAIVRLLAGEALGGFDPADDRVGLISSWAGGRKIPTGYYQTIPGNLVMFVLLSTMTYGSALLAIERRNGILRRLAASPLTRTEILAGKLMGRGAVASVQVGVFLLIGLTLFRIDWGRSPGGLAALLLTYILCSAAIGLLSGTLFESPQASAGIGVTLSLIMAGLGGCWWPSEVMPAWLRTASYVFPAAWAVNGLHQLVSWGGSLKDILPHCAVLALMGLAAGAVAVRRLRLD
jgi:hypothetical protein